MSAAEASESYANPDEYIQYKLQKARRRIKFADLLTAGLLAAVLLIGYVLIFTVLDHWVVDGGFDSWTRAIGLGVVLLLCSVIVVRYVLVPWFKTIHPLYAARILDGSGSSLKGALVSLVDLNSGKDEVSESVRSVMEKRAAVTLSDVNVDDAIDQSWLMKLGITLFVLVVLTSLYALISPKGINLLRPLTVANAAVATQTRILKVDPGSTTIAAGETLEVSVDLGGQLPEEVLLQYTTADKTYVDEVLTLGATDSETQFQTIIIGDSDRGLRQNFTYRILAGDAVSEDFTVIVDQPPSANVVEVNYDYPGYMMMARHETADGNMAAWEGTKVQLVAEATVPIKRATLRFSDTATFDVPAEEIPLMTREQQILGEFTLELRQDRSSPKFYRIDVEDFEGRIDPQPTVYAVNIREDKAPVVKLLDPIRDLHVPANAIIPMLVQAEDPDFMLRNVKLAFDVNGTIQTPAILYDGTRTALTQKWTGTYDFRLEDLDLKPGDIVNYYATARDNKPPLGTMSPSSNLKLMITEPESDEQIQKRLEQDRQLQKQQFQEQQEAADQNQTDNGQDGGETEPGQASEESSSDGQTGEQQNSDNGKPGQNSKNRGQQEGSENDGSPQAPSEGEAGESSAPTDPNRNQEAASDAQSGEGQQAGEQPGQPGGTEPNSQNRNGDVSDPSNVSNDDKATNDPKEGATTNASKSADPNQSADRLNPDAGSESDSGNQRSVDDSEAMQKLLEKYRNENGGIDPPKQDAGNSAETPAGDSGEQTGSESENQQTSNGSQDDREAEPGPSKSDSNDGDGQEAEGQNQSTDPKGGDEASNTDPSGQSSQQQSTESTTPGEGTADSKPQNDMNQGTESQQAEGQQADGQQEHSQNSDGSGDSQTGEANQDGDAKGQQSSNQQNAENQESQDGKSGGDSKSGGQDGKSGGESKSGGQDGKSGGDSKSEGQDGKSGGDSKSGGQDGKSGGDSKSGGQDGKSGGDSKSGGQDGKSGGDSKSGGQDGKSGGDSKSGGQGGKSDGDSKSGGQDGKSGGDSKSGGQDGKSGGESKPGGQDGKSGGDSKSGGQDGKSGGESKSGGKSGKGESKSGASGGSQQSGGEGGESSGAATGQKGGMGGSGGAAGSPNGNGVPPAGAGGNSDGFEADDPNVKASAEAADLVLKRLQQDLERGDVDRDLLKELGWTEDQLKQFQARMQKNLEALKSADSQTVQADQLRRRRAEELLKSLDLKGNSTGQKGSTSRDVEQQDTTSRRTKPPASYRDWMEMYQRGLSKGRPKARE